MAVAKAADVEAEEEEEVVRVVSHSSPILTL
jgi:hypothetical protein